MKAAPLADIDGGFWSAALPEAGNRGRTLAISRPAQVPTTRGSPVSILVIDNDTAPSGRTPRRALRRDRPGLPVALLSTAPARSISTWPARGPTLDHGEWRAIFAFIDDFLTRRPGRGGLGYLRPRRGGGPPEGRHRARPRSARHLRSRGAGMDAAASTRIRRGPVRSGRHDPHRLLLQRCFVDLGEPPPSPGLRCRTPPSSGDPAARHGLLQRGVPARCGASLHAPGALLVTEGPIVPNAPASPGLRGRAPGYRSGQDPTGRLLRRRGGGTAPGRRDRARRTQVRLTARSPHLAAAADTERPATLRCCAAASTGGAITGPRRDATHHHLYLQEPTGRTE